MNLSLIRSNLEVLTFTSQNGFEKSLCDHYITILFLAAGKLGSIDSKRLNWRVLWSSSISLDKNSSKIRKVSRCRPAVLNKTILAARQEFFFTKLGHVQSITDIVLLDFWLMLLSWIIISCYTIIYFSVKKFICLNIYISVITIFECFYMFFDLERDHQLTVRTQLVGWWRKIIQNACSCVKCDFSVQKLGLSFQS